MGYLPSNLTLNFAKKILQDLGAECRKKRLNVTWERENGNLKKMIYSCQERNLLAAPRRVRWELEEQSLALRRWPPLYPFLPCNTRISHRRCLQESQGRCTAEDAGCARILPLPPSAAGWPSPYPFHSYVLQTGLSTNKQSTGTCPWNQKDFGD